MPATLRGSSTNNSNSHPNRLSFGTFASTAFLMTLLVPVLYVLLETMREKFVSVEEEIAKRESI